MATTTARGGTTAGDRTPAQWYALLVGAVLVLAGVLGFIAEPGFGTGDDLDRGSLLGFDVNGWHNLVHLGSGVFLLAFARSAPGARMAVLAFAAIYAVVTLWGLITGDAILGLIPINTPDNLLHLALSAVGFAAALASPTHDDGTGSDRGEPAGRSNAGVAGSEGSAAVASGRFKQRDDSNLSPTGNQGDRPAR